MRVGVGVGGKTIFHVYIVLPYLLILFDVKKNVILTKTSVL